MPVDAPRQAQRVKAQLRAAGVVYQALAEFAVGEDEPGGGVQAELGSHHGVGQRA
jgi:hypothetical protein